MPHFTVPDFHHGENITVAFFALYAPPRSRYWIGKAIPTFPYWPKFIDFLGYCPYDPAWTPGKRLAWTRKYLGLTQKAMARRLGVDPGTLAKWERGEKEPKGEYRAQLERILLAGG